MEKLFYDVVVCIGVGSTMALVFGLTFILS
jgi:hypothetical protein